jgi:hypothetical protein
MDDVQPGKITGRRGRVREGHFRVASGTGGISVGDGRGWAICWALQAIQCGFGEMATPKHGENCSICRGGLQVLLLTEWEGFARPASQRFTTIEDVSTHILGNAVTGGPWGLGGDSGAEFTCAMLVFITSSPLCIQARKA